MDSPSRIESARKLLDAIKHRREQPLPTQG
jgi:hypothetical protein